MTMTSLLRAFGHDAPRRVTASGSVLFDAVATPAQSGIRMSPHTFHGGVSEPPIEATDSRWWSEATALEREREEMAAYFPRFVEVPGDDRLPPAWGGTLDTGRGRFDVLIAHREDHSLPAVIPIRPKRFGRPRGRG